MELDKIPWNTTPVKAGIFQLHSSSIHNVQLSHKLALNFKVQIINLESLLSFHSHIVTYLMPTNSL